MLNKELKKVNCQFSQEVYKELLSERFGLKSCKVSPQKLDYLQDLKYLIEYLSKDYDTDNPALLGSTCPCDTDSLIEKVNGTY